MLGARRTNPIQIFANELQSRGGKAIAVTTDVTRSDQVKALVDAAVQTYGRIDVMLNCSHDAAIREVLAVCGEEVRVLVLQSSCGCGVSTRSRDEAPSACQRRPVLGETACRSTRLSTAARKAAWKSLEQGN